MTESQLMSSTPLICLLLFQKNFVAFRQGTCFAITLYVYLFFYLSIFVSSSCLTRMFPQTCNFGAQLNNSADGKRPVLGWVVFRCVTE